MDPKSVLAVFILLGVVWTGIWVWILAASRRVAPYSEIASSVARLRRRLVFPVVALAAIAFGASLGWLAYPAFRVKILGQPQLSVEATASQWAWALSRNQLDAGVPVEFLVKAKDVNHSFALYDPQGRLVAQVQAMPGYTNRLIYRFEQPGTYTVRCLEYCGIAHHLMAATVTVGPR